MLVCLENPVDSEHLRHLLPVEVEAVADNVASSEVRDPAKTEGWEHFIVVVVL